jgi:hypothetical protein
MSAVLKLEPVIARIIEPSCYTPSHEFYGFAGWMSDNKQALVSRYIAIAGCEGSDEYCQAEADLMQYEMHPGIRNDYYYFARCQFELYGRYA